MGKKTFRNYKTLAGNTIFIIGRCVIIYNERIVAMNMFIDPDIKMFWNRTKIVILFVVATDESAKVANAASRDVFKACVFIFVVSVLLP